MKRQGIFLLPPGWDASPSRRVTPSKKFAGEGGREALGELSVLLVKTLLSQEIFVRSVVDLKLNSKCGHMCRKKRLRLHGDCSNAFPGKKFCTLQVNT